MLLGIYKRVFMFKKFIDNLLRNHKLSPGSSACYANVKALVKAIPDWSTKVLDVAKVVNSGIYNNDCLAHLEVYEFFYLVLILAVFVANGILQIKGEKGPPKQPQ
jgi:hypothetical protein